jgi:hypothetical protein
LPFLKAQGLYKAATHQKKNLPDFKECPRFA